MRAKLVYALIAAAVLGCGCRPRADRGSTSVQRVTDESLSAAEIYKRSADAVVRIETPHSVATGFVVDARGFVVTHYDVVAEEQQARIILAGGDTVEVTRVLAADAEHGFAILATDGARRRALQLTAKSTAVVGDPVVVIGNGLGMWTPTLSQGVIGSLRGAEDDSTFVLSMTTLPGFVGGPVLDHHGRVIAIVSLDEDAGVAVSVAELVPRLRAVDSKSGETLAAFGDRTRRAAGRVSARPMLDESVLGDCSLDSRTRIWTEIQSALEISAPIFALGAHEAAFRVIESASLRLARDLEDCRTLLDVLATATADAEHRATPLEGLDVVTGTFDAVLELMFDTPGRKPSI